MAVFKRAYKTETKLSTIFACLRLMSWWSSGKWLSISKLSSYKGRCQLDPCTTYNLLNHKTNWTSCRQIRLSSFCRITRISVCWLDGRHSSTIDDRSTLLRWLCILLIKKKRNNYRFTDVRLLVSASTLMKCVFVRE